MQFLGFCIIKILNFIHFLKKSPFTIHSAVYLSGITLEHFKNYRHFQASFSPDINIITGANGSGKTNLLDAIYYLSFCKSYFNLSDAQVIERGNSYFLLSGEYCNNDNTNETLFIQAKYSAERGKEMYKNRSQYERISQHIGLLPLVMIAPDDLFQIKAGSEERRKLIDAALVQLEPKYLESLQLYKRCLEQRNALLKHFYERDRYDFELMEPFNRILIQHGTFIAEQRSRYEILIAPLLAQLYHFLSGEREVAECRYVSSLKKRPFSDILLENVPFDKQAQRTTDGIHRDDWEMEINGLNLKKFASQGQQKSYLLALKLALAQLTARHKGLAPLLLLDDIFDKLDPHRLRRLFELLPQSGCRQIFISDTDPQRLALVLNGLNLHFHALEIHHS